MEIIEIGKNKNLTAAEARQMKNDLLLNNPKEKKLRVQAYDTLKEI
jgi:hypothetical protein